MFVVFIKTCSACITEGGSTVKEKGVEMHRSKVLMNLATFLGLCLRLQGMMQQDPVHYCIKPAGSDWLRGMRGRSAHVIRPTARLTGTAAGREMSQVLIWRIPH